MYVCMYVRMHECTCVCVCVLYACMCVYVHVHTCFVMHAHACLGLCCSVHVFATFENACILTMMSACRRLHLHRCMAHAYVCLYKLMGSLNVQMSPQLSVYACTCIQHTRMKLTSEKTR